MVRVTAEDVRGIVDSDVTISMVPFIAVATALTDKVESNDSDSVLSTELLKEIERFLAAHFYSLRDPLFTSNKTGDASGAYEKRNYYDMAAILDTTGFLQNRKTGKKSSIQWLGLPPSEQTDYVDRD